MNAELIEFKVIGDARGSLIAVEAMQQVPFDIKRVYYIFDTQEGVRRGFHAHIELQQVAICVRGSCRFKLEDGSEVREVLLDAPNKCLLLKGLIWREMFDFSDDCVLLVLASEHYDEADYIRDYDRFKELTNAV